MSEPRHAFLVGAQKCGTTTLADMLARHPDIALSEPKEPQYYWSEFGRGRGWYEARFPADGAVRLDASTSYTMAHPGHLAGEAEWPVPARIASDHPQARFVYIVRDPVDRAVSAYWHRTRSGRETRRPEEALTATSRYAAVSRYRAQIALFLRLFDLDRFLFLTLKDLSADPAATLRRAALHLGVDPEKAPSEPARPANRSYQLSPAAKLARGVLGETGMKAASRVMRTVLPGPLQDRARSALTAPIPTLDGPYLDDLRDALADDWSAFRDLAGVAS